MSLIEDLITPELNKLEKVRGHSKHIYDFLTWMKENKKRIGKDVEDLVLDYYDIDKHKLAKERKMLKESLNRACAQAIEEASCTDNSESKNS